MGCYDINMGIEKLNPSSHKITIWRLKACKKIIFLYMFISRYNVHLSSAELKKKSRYFSVTRCSSVCTFILLSVFISKNVFSFFPPESLDQVQPNLACCIFVWSEFIFLFKWRVRYYTIGGHSKVAKIQCHSEVLPFKNHHTNCNQTCYRA